MMPYGRLRKERGAMARRGVASSSARRRGIGALQAKKDHLYPGEWFGVGFSEAPFSADNSNRLELDSDGMLRIYRGSSLVWQLGTFPGAVRAEMLLSGSLVVEDAQGRAIWQTPSSTGFPLPFLLVQNDGNVVIYEVPPSGQWHPIWASGTESQGFSLSDLVDVLVNYASVSGFYGLNVATALAHGGDPVAALKRDVSYLEQTPALAQAVASGDEDKAQALIVDQLSKIGVQLPSNVAALVRAAVDAHDEAGVLDAVSSVPGAIDPKKVQALISSPAYPQTWTLVTNAGRIMVGGLPPPKGMRYVPGAAAYVPPRPAHIVRLRAAPPAKKAAPSAGKEHGKAVAAVAGLGAGAAVLVHLGLHGWKWVTPSWAKRLIG